MAYPDEKVFASTLTEITIAQKNPDTVAEANDLNGVDVGIVCGNLGVAEGTFISGPSKTADIEQAHVMVA